MWLVSSLEVNEESLILRQSSIPAPGLPLNSGLFYSPVPPLINGQGQRSPMTFIPVKSKSNTTPTRSPRITRIFP